MLVAVGDFRKVLEALENNAFYDFAFFPEGHVVRPDLEMFDFALGDDGHVDWCRWHDDDFWEYVHYGLKELVGVMRAIEKGKIDLRHFIQADEENGTVLINVEDIYRLRVFPHQFAEMAKAADFSHKRDPYNPHPMDYHLGTMEYILIQLCFSEPGKAVACGLWDEHVPPGTLPRPAELPLTPVERRLPRSRRLTFKQQIGRLRPGR